jgi:hypothetical protein
VSAFAVGEAEFLRCYLFTVHDTNLGMRLVFAFLCWSQSKSISKSFFKSHSLNHYLKNYLHKNHLASEKSGIENDYNTLESHSLNIIIFYSGFYLIYTLESHSRFLFLASEKSGIENDYIR